MRVSSLDDVDKQDKNITVWQIIHPVLMEERGKCIAELWDGDD